MKQQHHPNKYSVAWFKIADFVSRGEKERALGVYRLLSHSIDDNALNLQLEGDILLSCHDDRAITKYEQAALCYEQQGRLQQAIGIYEHLLILSPGQHILRMRLIYLYTLINAHTLAQEQARQLVLSLLAINNILLLLPLFDQVKKEDSSECLPLAISIVQSCRMSSDVSHDQHTLVVKTILDIFLQKDTTQLNALITWLEQNDTQAYAYAMQYIQK